MLSWTPRGPLVYHRFKNSNYCTMEKSISYQAYKHYSSLQRNKVYYVDLEPCEIIKELKEAGLIKVSTDLTGSWYVRKRQRKV